MFLVQQGRNYIIVDGTQNFIYTFVDTDEEGHGSNKGKYFINLILVGSSKVYDPNQGNWLSLGIMEGLSWVFLKLLAVGSALLQYFLAPGTTWFRIHYYCNSLNFLFTITSFALAVHVLQKYGSKHFSFNHAIMVLSIFILVVFQVFV